ncbi:MAG: DNA polymerase III subunit delta [Desulfovibrio sp.]|jgi:DNA polymerase-3 subunit delta|nr:DNA polymerase III subunit delta [Desulfovibrio sp.]
MTGEGRPPGFTFLVCPDSLLLRCRLEALTAAFFPRDRPWDRHVHWGDEEPAKIFWEQLTLQGMFGRPRALIVRQAQQWPAEVWKRLSKALARPSPSCLSFFCLEVSFDKGRPKIPPHIAKLPCFDFAGKQGWIWRQGGLDERGVKRWAHVRAGELKLRFQPDALEQFCACLPPDASVIENELRKLALLSRTEKASGGTGAISAAMTALCASSAECNIFSLLRRIEAGDLPAALEEAARNRESEDLFFRLLALLAKDMRHLWRLKAGERVSLFPSDAEAKKRLADRMDFATLSRCMALVMDAEWRVKSGRCEEDQALDVLLAGLTRAFGENTGR